MHSNPTPGPSGIKRVPPGPKPSPKPEPTRAKPSATKPAPKPTPKPAPKTGPKPGPKPSQAAAKAAKPAKKKPTTSESDTDGSGENKPDEPRVPPLPTIPLSPCIEPLAIRSGIPRGPPAPPRPLNAPPVESPKPEAEVINLPQLGDSPTRAKPPAPSTPKPSTGAIPKTPKPGPSVVQLVPSRAQPAPSAPCALQLGQSPTHAKPLQPGPSWAQPGPSGLHVGQSPTHAKPMAQQGPPVPCRAQSGQSGLQSTVFRSHPGPPWAHFRPKPGFTRLRAGAAGLLPVGASVSAQSLLHIGPTALETSLAALFPVGEQPPPPYPMGRKRSIEAIRATKCVPGTTQPQDNSYESYHQLQNWLAYQPAGMKIQVGSKRLLMLKNRNFYNEARPDSFRFNLYGRDNMFLSKINYVGYLEEDELIFGELMFEVGTTLENADYKFTWTYNKDKMLKNDSRYAFIEHMQTEMLAISITFHGWEEPRWVRGFAALLNLTDWREQKTVFAPVLIVSAIKGFTVFKAIDFIVDYDRMAWQDDYMLMNYDSLDDLSSIKDLEAYFNF